MSLNKENIYSDLKKVFKFLYLMGRVVFHLGLFGLPIFYIGFAANNVIELAFILQLLMLMFTGAATMVIVITIFIILHHIEIRYFKSSYRMAYILLKYIMPLQKAHIECFDYELVSKGYKEVVKRGNEYFSIKRD